MDVFTRAGLHARSARRPGDPAAWARQLEVLIKDSQARKHLAERARARALQLTSIRMASAYYSLYHELLTARRELCSITSGDKSLVPSSAF
jgi:glycosyltransferase involved in cell wall biosynthesis